MQHDITILFPLQALVHPNPLLITGSFVVTPEIAHDIDVVMIYNNHLYQDLEGMGFHQTNKEEYLPDPTLVSTWRFNDYNVIVVKDTLAHTLWQAFTNIISDDTFDFTLKEDRITLHEHIKQAYPRKVKNQIDFECK